VYYDQYEGRQYCVLHFPGAAKGAAFNKALKRKLDAKDFNFRGVWFPDDVSFSGAKFNAEVDFFGAYFNAEANFSSATFEKANFGGTVFSERAHFEHSTFNASAVFSGAKFHAKANFEKATFKTDAYAWLDEANFSDEADFRETAFDGHANFAHASFQLVHFDKANLSAPSVFSYAAFGDEAYFPRTVFKAEVEFRGARFESAAHFAYASFSTGVFRDAVFVKKADFSHTIFNVEASFSYIEFCAEALFTSATFNGQAYFSKVTFGTEANFKFALFVDYVRFAGDQQKPQFNNKLLLDFQHARIERPDHVSFHTLTLLPHWFVNVDARKLDFTNLVTWGGIISDEIRRLEERVISSPELLLAVTCRQLAINAEDNHRYEEGSKFRYWAMELLREGRWRDFEFWDRWKDKLSRRFRPFSEHRFLAPFRQDWLYWLYWVASGYGERMLRAFLWLMAIWLIFAWLYTYVGFARTNPTLALPIDTTTAQYEERELTSLKRALTYSLGVMSLQRPEPRPLTTVAHTLVTLETILGPVQAALLALAIRRKFMR
jgi:uncharacterized protein YjbI with pentapeptide repeats